MDSVHKNRRLPAQPARSTGYSRWTALLLIALVAVTVAVVHSPALSRTAQTFDDQQYLGENFLVQTPSWHSAQRFLTEVLAPSTVKGYYQPLAMISLMLDVAQGGSPNNLRPFHRTSLSLHVANTCLLMLFLLLLFRNPWAAAAAGLLFGVHPVMVEPIPWIADRKTLLATFFAFGSLIAHVKYAERQRWAWYVLALLAFVLALLSKPTTTMLPLALLLLDYWPLRRLSLRAVLEKVPYLAISVISGVVTVISQGRTCGLTMPKAGGESLIVFRVCYGLMFYLWKFIWPTHLTPHYQVPDPISISSPVILASVLGVICVAVILLVVWRWSPAPIIGCTIFVLMVLPTMGAIRFTNVITSDKYAYLPAVGLATMVAWALSLAWGDRVVAAAVSARNSLGTGVSNVSSRGTLLRRRVLLIGSTVVLAAVLSLLTRRQLALWSDSITLHRYMIARAPRAPWLHDDLAHAFEEVGELHQAMEQYELVLASMPEDVDARMNLGRLYMLTGDLGTALFHSQLAAQSAPWDYVSRNTLGCVWLRMNRLPEAEAEFRETLRLRPEYPMAHSNLAIVLNERGQTAQAEWYARESIRLFPGYIRGHQYLGRLLLQAGRPLEAVREYQRVLELAPDSPEAVNNLAWMLATCGLEPRSDLPDAVALAQRALQMTSPCLGVLDTLAAAYANVGKFPEAVATLERGLQLAAPSDAAVLPKIRQRLELYRQGQPFRDRPTTQPATSSAPSATITSVRVVGETACL